VRVSGFVKEDSQRRLGSFIRGEAE